ncbi:hypothetical protein DXC89_11285 [Prevotella disiens]|uniref:Uncharacterized protein n=1 Tax=Prevotella disiens TaxID=28130 RepID=A0A3E4QAM0_9BACT|nr:hypothetical protein DXC89_11285 [Prevotella disiens]
MVIVKFFISENISLRLGYRFKMSNVVVNFVLMMLQRKFIFNLPNATIFFAKIKKRKLIEKTITS